LQQLGAGLVNCDKLAHNLYLPGTDCFHKIIEYFGSSILDSDGFINRKLLGDIVFNNKVFGLIFHNIYYICYFIKVLYVGAIRKVEQINLAFNSARS